MDSGLNTYAAITAEGRIERYFKSRAVNNSLLKRVEDPSWIKWHEENIQIENDDVRHFRIGRAVDCLLTDKENFNQQFFVFNVKRPTSLMLKFIDNLPLFALNEEIWHEDEFKRNINTGLYLRAYSYAGYKTNINTVIENFWTKGENCGYYRAREQANGKEILSADDAVEIDIAVKALEQLPDIREFFGRDETKEYSIDIMYQVPLYHTIEYPDKNEDLIGKSKDSSILFKGLLDVVRIDHLNKTIEPCDLKTTASNPEEFSDSFYKYGYIRQAAFYTLLLKEADGYFKDLQNQGYTILPFLFIVAPKKDFYGKSALKFKVSDKTLNIGTHGGYAIINGVQKYIRGINEYIEAYRFHRKFDIYNCTYWTYKNNYTLML
jgi:hypothetical protein